MVVVELLPAEAKQWGLLSNGKLGDRQGRLVFDVAAIMVNRALAAWTYSDKPGEHLMDIIAGYASIAKGWLVNGMMAKRIVGHLIWWTESFHSKRPVAMIIQDNSMTRHPVEAGVLQGSPVSLIQFAIYTASLIHWVMEYIWAGELTLVDDLGWVAIGSDINQVMTKHAKWAAKSIAYVSWWGLQFNTAQLEVALFIPGQGHKKYRRPKLTAKMIFWDSFVPLNKMLHTDWTSGWMCTWRPRSTTINAWRMPGQPKLDSQPSQRCIPSAQTVWEVSE